VSTTTPNSKQEWTTEAAVIPSNRFSLRDAEFLRLPRAKERCPISQLSRTTLCELIADGRIKAVKLRKKGAMRGIILINRQSLLDYLHSMEK
jgi:hypothetical protein